MNWRRIGDRFVLAMAAAAVWAGAVWLWPYFGPVAIVVVILLVVIATNLVDFALTMMRKRT